MEGRSLVVGIAKEESMREGGEDFVSGGAAAARPLRWTVGISEVRRRMEIVSTDNRHCFTRTRGRKSKGKKRR